MGRPHAVAVVAEAELCPGCGTELTECDACRRRGYYPFDWCRKCRRCFTDKPATSADFARKKTSLPPFDPRACATESYYPYGYGPSNPNAEARGCLIFVALMAGVTLTGATLFTYLGAEFWPSAFCSGSVGLLTIYASLLLLFVRTRDDDADASLVSHVKSYFKLGGWSLVYWFFAACFWIGPFNVLLNWTREDTDSGAFHTATVLTVSVLALRWWIWRRALIQ
jgi:hypothetical protein